MRSSFGMSCRSASRSSAGRVAFHEPGLAELLERNRERLRFTLDVADVFEAARIVFVCVGTPSTHSGDADLSAVSRVLDELPEVEPRSSRDEEHGPGRNGRVDPERARRSRAGARGGYVSNPEFLAEGTAIHDFTHPDRVVVGAFAEADADAVAALYEALDAPACGPTSRRRR